MRLTALPDPQPEYGQVGVRIKTAGLQLAQIRGARVIGTVSEPNHEYLRSLGAIPVTYDVGLADRVKVLARAVWIPRSMQPDAERWKHLSC